jgi:hypothetical protein
MLASLLSLTTYTVNKIKVNDRIRSTCVKARGPLYRGNVEGAVGKTMYNGAAADTCARMMIIHKIKMFSFFSAFNQYNHRYT